MPFACRIQELKLSVNILLPGVGALIVSCLEFFDRWGCLVRHTYNYLCAV